MRVLVTGAAGQVGTELLRLADDDFRVFGFTRENLDIAVGDQIAMRLDECEPDLVVNCAAFTAVDRAEDEPEAAYRANAHAAGLLGAACAAKGVGILHLSTDYVFDGTKHEPYVEEDAPNPQNVYGASKLEGEQRLRETTDRHLILRVGWVFGRIGRSFVDTILRLAAERDELTVVDDQIGTPSPADAVARTVRTVAEQLRASTAPWGTYHFATTPAVSWCAFAREIVAVGGAEGLLSRIPKVQGIASRDWPSKSQRPLNSRLCADRLERTFGVAPAPWRPGLGDYLRPLTSTEAP